MFTTKAYRERESELMIKMLRENPKNILPPTRDGLTEMFTASWNELDIDIGKVLKQNLLTCVVDGTYDQYVSERLFSLVGKVMQEFRKELLNSKPLSNMSRLLKTITPPKGS